MVLRFGGAKNEHERRRRENRGAVGAEGGGVWGAMPLPRTVLSFSHTIVHCSAYFTHKNKEKIKTSIGAGLKHHSINMSKVEMMM